MSWGLTYIVTTELLPDGRPLLTGVLRALPAGLLLAAATRHRPTGGWWAKSLVLGTLNIGAFFALLFTATYRLPGGVAATLGAVQPLIAAALAAALLGERLRTRTVFAGVAGVIGVGLLVLRAGAALDALGVAAGLAGAASMATGVVLTKRWARPVPLLAFTSWQLIAGGLVLLPVALVVEGPPPMLTTSNLVGYTWLATGGTAVAYALWFRGIERLPIARVSLLGLLSPVVATGVGWLALHQGLTPLQLIGIAFVLGAVVVGQTRPTASRLVAGVASEPLPRRLVLPRRAVVLGQGQLRRGGLVDDDGHVRMELQHGGGTHRGDRSFHGLAHRRRLGSSRGDEHQVPRLEDRPDPLCDDVARDGVEPGEEPRVVDPRLLRQRLHAGSRRE
jgi:probable blue pigment (indigoidine) exporter